jgi:hypothetical protein
VSGNGACEAVMSDRGFTLAELLVAAALTLAVVALAVGSAGPARLAFDRDVGVADLSQRLRVGLDTLVAVVQAAGAGAAVAETIPLPDSVPAIVPLPSLDGVWAADRGFHGLRIVSVPFGAAQARLREPIVTPTDALRLTSAPACSGSTPTCGFTSSDLAIVFDETGTFDIFEIDAVDPGGRAVTPAVSLGATYAAGAAVAVVDTASYGLVVDVSGAARLVQRTAAGAVMPLLDHVVAFDVEPYGEAAPPLPPVIDRLAPSYGPRPPPVGVDDERDGWDAGENCTMRIDADGILAPRLAWLGPPGALVRLSPEMLQDGPWCPGTTAGSNYDADLLRVRRVDVRLRVEVASAQLRGPAGRLFARPGQDARAAAWVPDGELRLSMTPRNLARP